MIWDALSVRRVVLVFLVLAQTVIREALVGMPYGALPSSWKSGISRMIDGG